MFYKHGAKNMPYKNRALSWTFDFRYYLEPLQINNRVQLAGRGIDGKIVTPSSAHVRVCVAVVQKWCMAYR